MKPSSVRHASICTGSLRVARATGAACLALSVSLMSGWTAWAGPGDVNSTNVTTTVASGTYYNTAGSETVFQAAGSGLHIQSGSLVRGLEVSNPANPLGSLTNNGGALRFSAPGQVIRVDGTIDVSAVKSGTLYLGDGGRVSFESALLYQNGRIYANGARGGQVSMDVGSLTQTANGRIQAMGTTGPGGQVTLRAAKGVDLAGGSIIDASGHVIGLVNPALIRIEGSLVNVDGVLRANGVTASGEGGHGGVIRLTATGAANDGSLGGLTTALSLSDAEKTALQTRHALLASAQNGDVTIGASGLAQANGSSGPVAEAGHTGNGGVITLVAFDDIVNAGQIQANGGRGADGEHGVAGGRGGSATLQALGDIQNNGAVQVNGGRGGDSYVDDEPGDTRAYQGGVGGDGGQALFQYGSVMTQGVGGSIQANGGDAGDSYAHALAWNTNNQPHAPLVIATAVAHGADGAKGGKGGQLIFDGPVNPTGAGSLSANGGAGGDAGNAEARVFAHASSVNGEAIAKAQVFIGHGGAGGDAGSISAPNPATFGMTYSARRGVRGDDGNGEISVHAVGRTAKTEAIIEDLRQHETKRNTSKIKLGYWHPGNGEGQGDNAPLTDADDLTLPPPPVFENGGSGGNGGSGSNGDGDGDGDGGGGLETGGNDGGSDGGSNGGSGGADSEILLAFDDPGLYLMSSQRRAPAVQAPRNGQSRLGSPLIVFGQPTMFMAKAYQSVTEVILKSADMQYQTLLANGETEDNARQSVARILSDQGVDATMAAELLKSIEAGALQSTSVVTQILGAIAHAGTPTS